MVIYLNLLIYLAKYNKSSLAWMKVAFAAVNSNKSHIITRTLTFPLGTLWYHAFPAPHTDHAWIHEAIETGPSCYAAGRSWDAVVSQSTMDPISKLRCRRNPAYVIHSPLWRHRLGTKVDQTCNLGHAPNKTFRVISSSPLSHPTTPNGTHFSTTLPRVPYNLLFSCQLLCPPF